MILFENTYISGWKAAIRGMRNPMNSWNKSDTVFVNEGMSRGLGNNDYQLMMKLSQKGQVHGKFLRMITVTMDVTAPLYWWKEFDTYKVGTVSNSCSTMHKIHSKEFEWDDFSCEHLFDDNDINAYIPLDEDDNGEDRVIYNTSEGVLNDVIRALNHFREQYIKTKNKNFWWQMIQLLPSSYNQKRTIQLNYAVLKEIYEFRNNHKMDEWVDFCEWIKTLPYSELITGEKDEEI